MNNSLAHRHSCMLPSRLVFLLQVTPPPKVKSMFDLFFVSCANVVVDEAIHMACTDSSGYNHHRYTQIVFLHDLKSQK